MSNRIFFKRIAAELRAEKLQKVDLGISFSPIDDNLKALRGEIAGPSDTPYEGGKFEVNIIVSDNYPFAPPILKFTTKIWHPNVDPHTGKTLLFSKDWAAGITIKAVLILVQSLLYIPEPNCYQDICVAVQYKDDPAMFERTARHWTQAYAGAPGSSLEFDDNIKYLMNFGTDVDSACEILSKSSWNLDRAVFQLLSSNPNSAHNSTEVVPKNSTNTASTKVSAEEQINHVSTEGIRLQASAGKEEPREYMGQRLQEYTDEQMLQIPRIDLSSSHFDEKITLLMSRGVDEATARNALSQCFWSVEKAYEMLLGMSSTLEDPPESSETNRKEPELSATNLEQSSMAVQRPSSVFDDKIQCLMNQGIEEAKAIEVLSMCFWDLNKASDMLIRDGESVNWHI